MPPTFERLLDPRTLKHLNVTSSLVATALSVMLIATAPEEFGIPECADTGEAAGLKGPYRWGVILPNSSRVSLLTYKAIVAVRYPELVTHGHGRAAAFSRCGNVFFPLRQLFGLQSWTFSAAGFFPASAGFFLASDGFFPASDGFFPLPPKCIFSAAKVLLCCCKVFFLLL